MSKKSAAAQASAESLAALAEFKAEAPRVYPSAKQAPTKQTAADGKRRPGRPRSEGETMVPFASRVRESRKQQLAQLAHATGQTETALLDEALSLLFRRHKVNS